MKGLIFSIIVKNAWVGTSVPALKRSKLITILLMCVAMAAQAQNSPEEKFNMAMYAVTNMYVDSVNKAKFVDEEIAKMLKSLDPFSEYLPPMRLKPMRRLFSACHHLLHLLLVIHLLLKVMRLLLLVRFPLLPPPLSLLPLLVLPLSSTIIWLIRRRVISV